MENIDFGNTYFSTKGMMPEDGDNITLMWARKLVKNLANAYGIIGTVNFNNGRGYRTINLQLTKRYQYPPSVFLYHKASNGLLAMPIETTPPIGEFNTIIDNKQYEIFFKSARKNLWAIINGDALTILNASTDTTYVYYRVIGA